MFQVKYGKMLPPTENSAQQNFGSAVFKTKNNAVQLVLTETDMIEKHPLQDQLQNATLQTTARKGS